MPIIRFETNVPVECALKFADGKEVEGNYGPQFLFTTTTGDTMYVAPVVEAQIAALGIEPGERIQIVKREAKNGRAKSIEWKVTRVDASGQGGNVLGQGTPAPRAVEAQRPPSPNVSAAAAAPARLVEMPAAPASAPPLPMLAMGGCLKAAIDSLVEAQVYAKTRGLEIRFDGVDVRTTAASIYIQYARTIEQSASRNGGASWQR